MKTASSKGPRGASSFVCRLPALAGALLVALPGAVLADCPDGGRDATAHEKETAVRVLTVLRDAFAAPAGWKVAKDTRPEPPRSFCKGTTVLTLRFERTLTRVDGMTERKAAHDRRLAEARRLTPEEQQQLQEVDREIADRSREMGVPRSTLKNRNLDRDTRARLEAELRRLGDGMKALHQRRRALASPWLDDGPRRQRYEEVLRDATRDFRQDTEITVRVEMNGIYAPLKAAARIDVPGAVVAYRSPARHDAPDAYFDGTTSVLIGHARARAQGLAGELEPAVDPDDPSRPRTFAVSIQADADRALQMAGAANEPLRTLTR